MIGCSASTSTEVDRGTVVTQRPLQLRALPEGATRWSVLPGLELPEPSQDVCERGVDEALALVRSGAAFDGVVLTTHLARKYVGQSRCLSRAAIVHCQASLATAAKASRILTAKQAAASCRWYLREHPDEGTRVLITAAVLAWPVRNLHGPDVWIFEADLASSAIPHELGIEISLAASENYLIATDCIDVDRARLQRVLQRIGAAPQTLRVRRLARAAAVDLTRDECVDLFD